MSDFKNILAVVQREEEAAHVLAKAKALTSLNASGAGASVHVVRVVYEGVADLNTKHIQSSHDLKNFILSSEESALLDAIEASNVKIDDLESATVWHQKTWQGILDTAQLVDADLIIKAATHTDAVGEILRTPDDWNLVRHTPVPVLMSQARPWPTHATTLAAVDVFDDRHRALNERILSVSESLSDCLDGQLHIGCAYPMFEPWMDHFAGINSYKSLREDIESDIRKRIQRIAKASGVDAYRAITIEGKVQHAMQSAIERLSANVLVLGTKARTGVEGFVLGNTAEKLLYHINADVLCVP